MRAPFSSLPRRRDTGHEEAGGYYTLAEPWAATWDDASLEDEPSQGSPSHDRPDAGRLRWVVRGLAGALLLLFVAIGYLFFTAPLSKSLEPLAPPQITLLAADGTPIARKGAYVDDPVRIDALPPHVVNAFLAIEDRRFYTHWGIDPRGMARAAWTGVGGGSTITQQLAKFTFLTPEQTLTRKAREVMIAFWLEAWLSKDEILERYLSNAYFGDNTYGLRAASLHFFHRQPERLTPAQAAMLAGLLQAPSAYNPVKHYARAERRMRLVVGAMEDAGYISADEARSMKAPRLDVRRRDELPAGTYFADWVMPQAQQVIERGYETQEVVTTLDSRLQRLAERVVRQAPAGSAQMALVAMRPSGEVVALVGGRNYARSAFNRATQARRQPGSTFKLFVYLTAVRQGMDLDDTIDGSRFTTGTYRPQNFNGGYRSEMTLREAFAESSNVAAVRLIQQVGTGAVIDTARALGVTAPLDPGDPTMALGTAEMSLMELTAAYAAVAAGAYPVKPHGLPQAERGWISRMTDGPSHFSRGTQQKMQELLRSAVDDGTGRAARLAIAAYGKTGTTQDHRDALFVGYAGDLVVGVWVGNDDNSPLQGVSGGGLPARVWREFMGGALGVGAAPVVQPLPRAAEEEVLPDVPLDAGELPLLPPVQVPGSDVRVRVREGDAVVSTDIGGEPLEVSIGRDGVRFDGRGPAEMRRRAAELRREAREQARQIEERGRRAGERAFEEAFPPR
ncbi:penicillin-binding protein [Erythrobacteraceae bacterium CFH 75059]|nr:penicillin-binding protein [Erythrobacteraceae bacterium CFH 75059]